MTQRELKKIIEKHGQWLKNEFTGENRHYIPEFDGESLYNLDFTLSDLSYAEIRHVAIDSFNPGYWTISYMNHMDFTGTLFSDCSFKNTFFAYTNLTNTTFNNCKFDNVLFSQCSLNNSDFTTSKMRNIDYYFEDPKLLEGVKLQSNCPNTGSFIAYKAARTLNNRLCVVKLEIPEDAKRTSGFNLKCRCNKAKVLAILDKAGKETNIDKAKSIYDHNFKYRVGGMVEVDNFEENRFHECSHGIHFFMEFNEAVSYKEGHWIE